MPPFPTVPPKGEIVPIDDIRTLCQAKGLPDLWSRIEADRPVNPFKSDGCTAFFDQIAGINIYPACFFHDLKYWAGYPEVTPEEYRLRFIADGELMTDVVLLGADPFIGVTMFHGVRAGGGPLLKLPFSWGFGRHTEP